MSLIRTGQLNTSPGDQHLEWMNEELITDLEVNVFLYLSLKNDIVIQATVWCLSDLDWTHSNSNRYCWSPLVATPDIVVTPAQGQRYTGYTVF